MIKTILFSKTMFIFLVEDTLCVSPVNWRHRDPHQYETFNDIPVLMLRDNTRCSMLCLKVLSTEMERYKANNSNTTYNRYSRAGVPTVQHLIQSNLFIFVAHRAGADWSGHLREMSTCIWNVSVCKLARQPFCQGVRLQDRVLEYKKYLLKKLRVDHLYAGGETVG